MNNFIHFAAIFSFSIFLYSFSSPGKTKDIKAQVRALAVAQKFVDAINESRFSDAYAVTDKNAKIAPAWFLNLEVFIEHAKRERPFSETNLGKSKIEKFRFIDSKTFSVEFFFQFEVRLCRQSSNEWKVCYFQAHAG